MVQPGQNPRDSAYDPFTYLMFGPQNPQEQPPQAFYQNGGGQTSSIPGGAQWPPSQSSIVKPFLDQNGHIDIGKVMNGATQFVNIINQTAPAIKQLSPLLKLFQRP